MPDAKNKWSNSGWLLQLVGAVGVQYSEGLTFRTEQIGCTVVITGATGNGSLQVQHYENPNQVGEAMLDAGFKNLVAARPVVSGADDRFDINGHNEPVRVKFTPDDLVTPYTLTVKVSGFGG